MDRKSKYFAFSRRKILRESFFITAFVIFLTYSISFIPWSLEYGKALHQGFADFDIYDLYYSGRSNSNPKIDTNIVLVEAGDTRSEIANQILIVNRYKPKVIGLDILFEGPNPDFVDDTLGDGRMKDAVAKSPNLVLSYRQNGAQKTVNYFTEDDPLKSGYVDFIGVPSSVVRAYSPYRKEEDKIVPAFTTSIIRMFDEKRYDSLMVNGSRTQLIDYKNTLKNYFFISKDGLFAYDSTHQLDTGVFRGKIVLIGFFKSNEPLVMNDLHYTPLNEVVSGKSFPDMYGVLIHANILSMLLRTHHPLLASAYVSYFCAFLLTFLFTFFIVSQFHKKKHHRHGFFLLVQVIVILLVLYVFLQAYSTFLFKVPLEPIMISLVLTLEMLGLYKTFALWLHKKYNYQTLFTSNSNV